MGAVTFVGRLAVSFSKSIALGFAVCVLSSCSIAPTTTNVRLLHHRAMLDFTGLKPVIKYDSVRVTAAPPIGWERLATKKTALYTHEQWRSPSEYTGVGVAHVKMPLPLGARAIAWFAKQEYGKKAEDGKILGEWSDALGREWFEVENKKYHVRGYVMTRGLDAWIVYTGYRLTGTPDPAEISLAMRSAETIVPNTSYSPSTQPAVHSKGPTIVDSR